MQQRDRTAAKGYGRTAVRQRGAMRYGARTYTGAYPRARMRMREAEPKNRDGIGLWVLLGQMAISALALAAIFTMQYVEPDHYQQVGQYYAELMSAVPTRDATVELLRTPVTAEQLRNWWEALDAGEIAEVFRVQENPPAMGGEEPTFPRNASYEKVVVSAAARSPLPCDAVITSGYGERTHPITGKWDFHTGIDLAASEGTAIHAIYPGRVEKVGYSDSYGNFIVVRHSETLSSIYCHCSVIYKKAGAAVLAGETIAKVGSTGCSTGPHLHLSVLVNGYYIDPMNLYA